MTPACVVVRGSRGVQKGRFATSVVRSGPLRPMPAEFVRGVANLPGVVAGEPRHDCVGVADHRVLRQRRSTRTGP